MPYPVTSAISSNLIALVFVVPFNDWYMNAATGQLNALCSAGIWDDNIFVDPDVIADFTEKNWQGIQFMPAPTGSTQDFPVNHMEWIDRVVDGEPSGWLPCDGDLYSAVSYPNLFDLIGYTFGGSGGAFATPDYRGRTRVNADDMGTPIGAAGRLSQPWASTTGGAGGGETVLLDIAHMPTHDHPNSPHTHTDLGHVHGVSSAAPNATTIGPGAPQPTAVPLPGFTSSGNASLSSDSISIGDNGGNEAHENVQPSGVAFTYIWAY